MEIVYSARQVARIAEVTQNQIRVWKELGRLLPSYPGALYGGLDAYSEEDVQKAIRLGEGSKRGVKPLLTEKHCTIGKAVELTGVHSGVFYRWEREGRLQALAFPGRQKSVYRVSDVLRLAEQYKRRRLEAKGRSIDRLERQRKNKKA